ncbi:hypothetical protein OIDMADRAFT_104894 [Oidiodendron maius Zn]|uniref:Uncharacterized protein n=1 Tax=Oidiodendron maius (strain Zn) TaxID=913774 RepID=A0A0C3DAQ7_OIDMZ|nr:hypothetical protein OIDMADRAFT_104894 [Oidiodendron maius Zn]
MASRSRRALRTPPRSSRTRPRVSLGAGRDRTPKRRAQYKQSSSATASSESIDIITTNGVIPPWQSLPYHVFVQIFQYASYPLYDDHTFQPLPSGSWLLKVARLCRAFAEPAFTVLYTSPPLVPMEKAHMLVDLLKMDPTALAFKYRHKVQSLRIDVGQVAAYSLPGSGHLDLFSFVKDLPRLQDLEFYHQKDMSPYRYIHDSIKWTYPESLFDALEYVDPAADPQRGDKMSVCKLSSWRWSSRLAGKKYPIESIRDMHLKPSFANLRKIAFVNYQIPAMRKGEEIVPEHEKILADALLVLENLEHLIFESSTLVNEKLLPLLPRHLRAIELINCWELTAEQFGPFLLTHGSQLRCLTLNHNQSLSMSFLPQLGVASPELQVFKMNLTYFNDFMTHRGTEPEFEELLHHGEVPVWPKTLQTIELTQLRKWDAEAAEMFFQSLLDRADALPDLRILIIQAILNIGWRDRATFRDKWVGSLERVFKRVSDPPRRHISIESMPRVDTSHSSQDDLNTSPQNPALAIDPSQSKDHDTATRRSARTSTRDALTGRYAESPDSSADESEPRKASQPSRRSQIRQSGISRELAILKQTAGMDSPRQANTSSSDSDSASLVRRDREKGNAKQAIQGMCEIVDIRIDNLRPRETQATEADFLDEEIPGDADWNGEDVVEEGYAW